VEKREKEKVPNAKGPLPIFIDQSERSWRGVLKYPFHKWRFQKKAQ
jgi:hypothetical protein